MIREQATKKVRPDRTGSEGAALIWVAGSLVMLLGFAALAVDVGWILVNRSRLQAAADSAALAGVVHIPSFPTLARTDARGASAANGYITTGVGANTTFADSVIADDTYQVTLSRTINLFLAPLIGVSNFNLAATSTAKYIPPVPIGSPDRCFGAEPASASPKRCNGIANPGFYAAIKAPYTDKEYGDPFSTNCNVNNNASSCNSANVEYGRGPGGYVGYYYAVEIPAGATNITMDLYDAGWYDASGIGDYWVSPTGTGVTTNFRLMDFDGTLWDPTDNPTKAGCTTRTIAPEASSGTYRNRWATVVANSLACNIPSSAQKRTYVFRVWTTGNGAGSNAYSIAVNATGGSPRVYGINDMSIYSPNATGGHLNIAEVAVIHAGKQLQLSFFDPGDSDPGSYYEIRKPDDTAPANSDCSWVVLDANLNQVGTGTGCQITTGGQIYNSQWIIATVEIRDDYVCDGSDCWWWMYLNLVGNVTESTTWKAKVVGNPLRLIPNP